MSFKCILASETACDSLGLAVGQLAHTFQGHCVKRLWAPEKNLLDKIVEFRDAKTKVETLSKSL